MVKGLGGVFLPRLLLAAAVLLVTQPSTAEEDKSSSRFVPTKKLWGARYSEAVSARMRADRMRAELEQRMPPARTEPAGKEGTPAAPGAFDAQAAEVARAYKEVIDRYPHTEIAAYCALRLSGFYQYQGKFDEALELSAKTAGEFAGTLEGFEAAFNTGLIYAQARHEPAEASKWFARIPKPNKPADVPYDEADKLYLSAQQQLTKCELALGRDGQAEARASDLTQTFPQHGQELDRSFRFEVASRDARGSDTGPATVALNTKAVLLIALGGTLVLIGLFLAWRSKRSGDGS